MCHSRRLWRSAASESAIRLSYLSRELESEIVDFSVELGFVIGARRNWLGSLFILLFRSFPESVIRPFEWSLPKKYDNNLVDFSDPRKFDLFRLARVKNTISLQWMRTSNHSPHSLAIHALPAEKLVNDVWKFNKKPFCWGFLVCKWNQALVKARIIRQSP